ncbi:phage holin family protein [Micromonospora sp. HM5-17]|jgi:Flp pilus assembly protein TadB|uniref:phage holin family protein n=1 Tax=Micromonospora sp. HM5-17 TaxID=2487710 RepID=UPI000F49D648|nr:phage holin family protein [Micromonospora sp. HM5-17]ROT33242.1 phage holin family protein [Micromonospora sp. HM5-17]
MAEVVRDPARPVAEQSTAELVQRATEQLSRLVRDELALARIELTEKGRQAGIGVGLLGGGGVLALCGLGVLAAAAVLALALVIPGWAAALVVAGAFFLLGGVVALSGRRRMRRAAPPVPTATADSLKTDVRTVASAVRDRGRE